MSKMDPIELDSAASPGPWTYRRDGGDGPTAVIRTGDGREIHVLHRGDGLRDADLEVMVAGRALVAEAAHTARTQPEVPAAEPEAQQSDPAPIRTSAGGVSEEQHPKRRPARAPKR